MKPPRTYSDPMPNPGFGTIATHYADDYAGRAGAAAPPIYQSSTFIYPDAEAFANRMAPTNPHYDYTRVGNPTT
ncbi:MAG: PLP-dependent transferase [Planctomycetes bacterium]|nr:PLP-dependent transferase [Planctomycetota bacterium]